jgi:transcriptional regulator GlxA family with amidase domain
MRWGFLHQSRFAQQYRERFGERPRDTLRLRNTG